MSSNPQTDLVARMAQVLAGAGVDLGNERACMRALLDRKFALADIISHIDHARTAARSSTVSS
jgi:hypothetical protein